ncbi:PAS domain-containing protein [Flavobacterium psychroterrae]|uniref:histidine kinase n=1 Tax=Flavobacterium psychroterrae TaxID=2133767 RepID=A0ABS5P563_9FLAO|nr:PAS domain-containing protein [Flavobacterium psychroterrae]MBS7229414.1 PAS domain-containing protein [Flavobacterium psychroterrae]
MPLTDSNLYFLRGGGEMGEYTRNYNWSATEIGSPDQWQQSLRTIVSTILNSKFPMFLWWGENLIQFYNDAYRPSLGNNGKHPQALGSNGVDTWSEIWHVIYPLIKQVLNGGESTWMENQLIPIYRNGSLENVYWTFSYSPVFDDSGKIGGVLVTCTETTDAVVRLQQLNEANNQLQLSLDYNIAMHNIQIEKDLKFKNVTNMSPAGLWLADKNGLMTYVNKTLSDWTGLHYKEVLGDAWPAAIVEEDRNTVFEAFTKAVAEKSHYDVQFHLKKGDGSIIKCHAAGDPFYMPDGELGGYAGYCMDIQALVEGQEQINESEQRFFNLTRQATVGIIVLTGDNLKVNIVNDAYAGLIGRNVEDLLDKNLFEIIPEAESTFRPIIEKVRVTGEAVYIYRTFYSVQVNDTKKEGYLNVIYQPYREIDGKITGVIAMCRDVTEQVQAQIQIEENERLLRTVIEKTPVATALFLRENLVIALANEVMAGYWKKGNSIIGKPYREAVPELHNQGYFEILENVFETGIEYHATGSQADIEKDGKITTQYFNYSYTPLFNESGEVYAVLNMGYDVTDSTITKNLLEESRQKLLNSFENSPVGIAIIKGDDLVFDMANTFYSSLAGRTVEELTGKALLEALPELEGQGFDTELRNVMATGKTFTAKEAPVSLIRNGKTEVIYIDHSYQAQRDANGEIHSVLVVVIEVTQQILARKRIEESEKRFRSLIEEAPVGTCLYVGPNMRIEIANKIIMNYWGRGPEVIGKNMIDVFPETVNQPFPEILKRVYETGEIYEQKGAKANLMIQGTLSTFYFDFTYKPLFDSDGKVYAILDVATDVTDQVKASRQLEKNQEFIRKIFYNSPVAKLVCVGKGMIVREANEKMLDVLGCDDSIVGKSIMETIPELKNNILIEKYLEVLSTGETCNEIGERIDLNKNGKLDIGYYDYTFKPLFDDHDLPYGAIFIVVEVTDKVYATHKQEQAEASLRDAIELAQLGTWSIDVATNGLTYSNRLIEWFGYDPSSRNYSQVIPILADEDRDRVANAVAWALKPESGGIYDETYTVIHPKTGQRRILHAQGKTIFNLEGNPIQMNGSAQDVTLQHEVQMALEQLVQTRTEELDTVVEDLKQSNVQLLHSNAELAQFAYIASHDLQEPLRKISTFSQLLESSLDESASVKAQKYIEKIMHSAIRMRTLINDVLNYSKLAKFEEEFTEVNLNEIIDNLILDYDLLMEEKNAKILVEPLPVIQANPLQMTQLFRNLISNALKFSKEDIAPLITISLLPVLDEDIKSLSLNRSIQEYCKIQIKDNGIGFEPEYFERIFNIFQRLHPKTSYEGTGIGLAMCKKIVQNHGGDIFAEAIPEQGAVFSIVLPLVGKIKAKNH